jgi:hypothetical protein
MLLARSKFEADKREAILHFEHILETLAVIPTVAVEIIDSVMTPKLYLSPNHSPNASSLNLQQTSSSSSSTQSSALQVSSGPPGAMSLTQQSSPDRVEAMYVCTTNECLYNLALTYYSLEEYEKSRWAS